ncbi:MAG: FAD-dependent oxidoreductase [Chloroflexi bacterium]|nr:FAD-dependent oxidoreductase [Chloroflexota bacterium]MCI0832212.1 FAD-dependent oxidoreductase [Chloroflexota bacterium]MCI0843112.1 FAD-dependent oxidoreductase [Chloroflexota bacterium]
MSAERCDVAVIGGGIAGLTTARELVAGGVDSVLVLEARDRVGGRTLNQPIPGGEIVEGGGEFVGPTQTAVVELARELGLETFPTYSEGDTVYYLGGVRSTGADMGLSSALGEGTPGSRLDEMAREIPAGQPWTAPKAAEWDAITVEDWLRENSVTDRMLIDMATTATLGATPAQISLLWFLFYIRSAGGLHDLLATRGGAQDSRIVGGSQLISTRMADALGERVRLSSPVRRISGWDGDSAIIECDGATIEAARLVIAMMPADVKRIEFRPALPEDRAALNERWGYSEVGFKAQAVYETAFWRDDGLSGQVLSSEDPQITFDNSPPSGTPGVILAFVDPRTAPETESGRGDWLVERLARYFGDKAREPIAYVECDWAEDGWTAGCVSPCEPGVLTSLGAALTEPCGRIHWAGTETSAVWNGYMDGAVRSGSRAAAEVIAAQRNQPATSAALG